MLKKAVKSILEPTFNIANAIYLDNYYKKIKNNKSSIKDIDPAIKNMKKALVVSPHQDDESIGLGGTMAKLNKKGVVLDIIYLTDGRLGEDDTVNSKIRLEEAKKACEIYGIDKNVVLSFINKTLLNNIDKLAEKIEKSIVLSDYDAIFLTAPYECNDDHFAAYKAILKLAKEGKIRENTQFYLYDINNSIQGEALNCISKLDKEEAEKKWKAYDFFKSQKYITFSTLKIMDKKKLNIDSFEKERYEAAEIFSSLSIEELIAKSNYDNNFRKKLHTATSSIRLIKFLESNKRYRKLMK